LTCREEVQAGEKRCPSCRARVKPLFIRPFVYLAVLSALFGGLFIGWKKLNSEAQARGAFEVQKDSLPGEPKKHRTLQVPLVPTLAPGAVPAASTTTVVPLVPQPLVPVSAEATSVAEPAQNGCGQSTSYDAAQLLDGDPSTAWRAVGAGKGIKITLTLPAAKRITEVGLIPGYDKTDQCTGIDRYVQMRRIKKVRWSFDDNTSVEQTFTDERSSQAMAVTAVSTHIFLEILETTTQRELDYTAISDIRIAGTAA
jgi:hypothetical protein